MRTGLERLLRAAHRARVGRETGSEVAAAWDRLKPVAFSDRTLARARIVTREKQGPAHAPFDMLRTRLRRVLQERGWRSVAVTSPTPGCGKTTTCLNLAFSLARQRAERTVLLELDLMKPQMAALLGVKPPAPILEALTGRAAPESCLLRYGQSLALGLASGGIRNSAEILLGPESVEALLRLDVALAPDVILYDLPPLFVLDDTLGFAAKADCALIVAAEGQSTLAEIDAAIAQLSRVTEVLGVAVNKSAFPRRDASYGYYGYYGHRS
jgi:Mrp family chromosome partitioning ATPase